ncbi:major facilitator superfamily domain-containing protein [Aspergillus pseudonomiae]|uniref:Major facilitator superfamily domain-containing protein n=1 Tax=Aspergillus pseudonomiae TaxID=1506151 RepID=A0A5N7CTU4_9EURO|nr:major facilitator superfamily domain-containing protein [Aspergillus pseudonomiae]KAE8397590.1 major facilitator superfamily domain-containing protein [Aspergillus pseudonomiae]
MGTAPWTRLRAVPYQMGSRSPYLTLAVVCTAMFLDLANLSAITIALPTIQKEWGTTEGDLQWIISAYSITFGAFLLLGGRGGDLFGHHRVLLFGMSFFALFTMVCGLAPNFIGLVVARALQGIGAAFTIPSAQAHIAVCFPEPAKKAQALGFWGVSGSLGFIIGLILGGVLTAYVGWRWIFWISLILSGIIIPAAFFILPRPDRPPADEAASPGGDLETGQPSAPTNRLAAVVQRIVTRFDPLGIALSVAGILLLTYALTSANTEGWGSARIVAPLVISVVLLALFVFHECRTANGIVAPHLFHSTSFNLTLVLAVNTYAVRQACTYFLTLQLQSYGNSAIHTSVLFIALGVSALIFNTLSGRLVPILGARLMFILGWGFSIPGVLLFSFIDHDTSYWRYTFPGMVLYIAGIGAVYITANFVVVSSASRADQGAVAGVFNVALQVGGSVLGLAVITAIAQGIQRRYGDPSLPKDAYGRIGYQSAYYSCVILCFIALLLSVFAIEIPPSMRGTVWKRFQKEQTSSMEEK